jgi:hypothetical protein
VTAAPSFSTTPEDLKRSVQTTAANNDLGKAARRATLTGNDFPAEIT